MALRKALAYSKRHARPYTRKSKTHKKSYIKTVPPQKIVKFKMGNIKDYEKGKFHRIIKLIVGENLMIRDNALESCRQFVIKALDTEIPGLFYFEVRVFPHHILRENKVLTGAGADRMQTGMAHSFGVTMGRAAMVKKGQDIFLIAVFNEKARQVAAKALSRVKAKIPGHSRIQIERE